jgi:hypothetical protein
MPKKGAYDFLCRSAMARQGKKREMDTATYLNFAACLGNVLFAAYVTNDWWMAGVNLFAAGFHFALGLMD